MRPYMRLCVFVCVGGGDLLTIFFGDPQCHE